MNDHGLDLTRPDATSQEEIDAFRDFFRETVGYPLPAFEPWIEFRPDVLKRYRLQVWATPSDENAATPLVRFLSSLHYYVTIGYEDGIGYEIRNAEALGGTRADVIETIALAFLDGGPRGMRYVATGALDKLRAYSEPDQPDPDRWPSGWSCDPALLESGLDFSSPELLPGELDLLGQWYTRVSGEVPAYVELLGRFRPNLLKAQRNRFEHTIRESLPTQALAFLLISHGVAHGRAEGVREAILMGRGLGLRRVDAVDAIAWGMMFGGTNGVSVALESAVDVLESWDRGPNEELAPQ